MNRKRNFRWALMLLALVALMAIAMPTAAFSAGKPTATATATMTPDPAIVAIKALAGNKPLVSGAIDEISESDNPDPMAFVILANEAKVNELFDAKLRELGFGGYLDAPSTPTPAPKGPPTRTATPTAQPAPTVTTTVTTGPRAWHDQQVLDGMGFEEAGADFFAIKVDQKPNGYMELRNATNGDSCNPSPILWQLERSENSRLIAQWSDCDRLLVSGTGSVSMTITLNPAYTNEFSLLLSGTNGDLVLNGVSAPLIPDAQAINSGDYEMRIDLNRGSFSIQLIPGAPAVVPGFIFEEVDDGWFRLKKGTTSDDWCAWSAKWKIEADQGIVIDWPICTQLNISGSGAVTVTVRPDSDGYEIANVSGLGLALWPMGNGGSYDVLLKNGTWKKGLTLDSGSDGINLAKDGDERMFIVHLTAGRAEIPLGDKTRDLTKPTKPVIEPRW